MMENNLQRMFAYQEIMAQRGKESICHSAILRCEHGSERCVLNLPKSHGNEADRMFDESTLMMEASVQKDVGFMVCTAARKG